jgi:hypothetical protein
MKESTMRRHLPLPALTLSLLLLMLPGVLVAKDKKDDKAPAGPSIRVAVFPPLNSTEEQGADRIMEDILKDNLKKVEAARATFLYPSDVERALTDHDQMFRIDQINERWAKNGQVDSTAIAGLDTLLMVDAILVSRIREWENHRSVVVGSGPSHATVGLSFALIDPRTMKVLWTKSPREQRFSSEIDAASSNAQYDETGVIQRKSDNAPPRYEVVANDLTRDAFKKFPRG